MSWFSVPLPNPFKALQFSDDENEDETQPDPESQQPPNDAVSPSSGLKDDLSAFGETLGRQFRGVASFLSPPPPPPAAAAESSAGDGGGLKLAGIRSDLAEIGGSFKTSLSLLSTTKAVSEISNLASNFFRLSDENEVGNNDDDHQQRNNNDDDDDDEDEGPGITDEVVEFASKISNRSELWIDFPLSLEQEFDMSDAQFEHAAIIEQLVPGLANLRSTLSSDISEKQFWMIYFILLLPRLNEDDLELLSTPEIVEARETLLLMLRSKNDTEITSENPESDGSSNVDDKVKDREMEKSRSVEEKATISDNLMASQSTEQVVADNSNARMVKEEHENTDNWLEQEEPITSGPSYNAPKRFQSEEDVSFSDLEDDDDDRPSQSRRASSPEESNEWVRLNQSRGQSSSRERESEGEESSDWLKVDDFDP